MDAAPYNRLVVISDLLTLEQQQQFVAWLGQVGLGWSHWMTGGWLLSRVANEPNIQTIRDNFLRIAPNSQVFVLNVDEPTDWVAWLKTTNIEHAKTWLRSQWGLNPVTTP